MKVRALKVDLPVNRNVQKKLGGIRQWLRCFLHVHWCCECQRGPLYIIEVIYFIERNSANSVR